MIKLENVSKSYEHGKPALNNINVTIDSGEMVFLTGHSGAGKTTLLKLIMMVERVNRGQIYLNGKNITRLSENNVARLRRNIGMIFQNPNLLPTRTIFENVAYPLFIQGYTPHEINRRVHAALDKVGLLQKEKSFPMELSGGEQQRVGIARAVVTKPSIMIADEPTGNLDPGLSGEIMSLFEAFNNVGVTVLVASHDLSLIASMNHRMLTLDAGQLVGGGNE